MLKHALSHFGNPQHQLVARSTQLSLRPRPCAVLRGLYSIALSLWQHARCIEAASHSGRALGAGASGWGVP